MKNHCELTLHKTRTDNTREKHIIPIENIVSEIPIDDVKEALRQTTNN